jgi:2-amino-4-hydroxy-6-hydroxymethyldihydropteridine diphosphokinase
MITDVLPSALTDGILKKIMATLYISLGSNLGDKTLNLCDAKVLISQNVGKILAESSIYESDAVDFEGNPFLNQVIKVETEFLPENLLQKTQEIEKQIGRTQKTIFKNGKPIYRNRIIDIDILLYDDLQIDSETLTIPHPRMFDREFVMKPLKEVVSG